jgi:hypothetical protein
MNIDIPERQQTSMRRSTSRVQVFIEVPAGINPYMRSEMWAKRVFILTIILTIMSCIYTITSIIFAAMYSARHPFIWFVNLACASVLLITSGLGIASVAKKIQRNVQFKLAIGYAVGLCLFLSAQLVLGLVAPPSYCIQRKPKPGTETEDPINLDVCTMTVEAIVVYTTICISVLLFSIILFGTFVRLRIMRQEDAIMQGIPPTPTGTSVPERSIL